MIAPLYFLMKPIKFKGCNCVYAKSQDEYLDLPAMKLNDGEVITCWELSFMELFKIFFTRRIWLSMLTFNNPLQPIKMGVTKPNV